MNLRAPQIAVIYAVVPRTVPSDYAVDYMRVSEDIASDPDALFEAMVDELFDIPTTSMVERVIRDYRNWCLVILDKPEVRSGVAEDQRIKKQVDFWYEQKTLRARPFIYRCECGCMVMVAHAAAHRAGDEHNERMKWVRS